jgi:phage portal protein BeeE
MGSDEDVSPGDMNDALVKSGFGLPDATEEKPRAMFHDPYSVMDWGGWRQRPSALTYETLRHMAIQNTVIAAIINLRVHQVAAFYRPQQGRYDKGYRIILRDRRDKKKGMTTIEQKEAERIERMIEMTGILLPGEKPGDRDNFRSFSKKFVRDTLTYDQACVELIRDRVGRVSRFIMLPSETIRPAVSDIEHMEPAELRNRVSHVQVYENTIIAEFSPDDLAWCVMNPRSDLRTNGFGFSPIEQIVRLVSSWLFGFEYNTRFFTQGSAIKGLLNIKGAIPDRQMRAFRRMWYSMVTGVSNAWKTPILNSEDVQWINMHSTNREMEYAGWMDWLTKLICAIYGVDPLEINFIFSASGRASGAMFSSRPNQAEVTESKDKGLRPIVTHIEDNLNQRVIWDLNPDFEFAFTGLDAKAEEKEREARLAEVKAVKTVNEGRADLDYDPLPGELGDIILDPTYLQNKTAIDQAAQMAQQGPQPGMGGAPGGALPPGQEQQGDPREASQMQNEDDDEHGGFMGGQQKAPKDDEEDLLAASEYAVKQSYELLSKAVRLDGGRKIIDMELKE